MVDFFLLKCKVAMFWKSAAERYWSSLLRNRDTMNRDRLYDADFNLCGLAANPQHDGRMPQSCLSAIALVCSKSRFWDLGYRYGSFRHTHDAFRHLCNRSAFFSVPFHRHGTVWRKTRRVRANGGHRPSLRREIWATAAHELTKSGLESMGQRLARLRKERGWTQVELAERTGIVQTVLSDYERGKLRLNADMIVRFASTLDITTDELLQPRPRKPSFAASQLARPPPPGEDREPAQHQQNTLLKTIDGFLKGVAS